MMYQVVAYVQRKDANGWSSTLDIPTFFLDSHIQGITSCAHAEKIARDMLNRLAGNDAVISIDVAVREQWGEA